MVELIFEVLEGELNLAGDLVENRLDRIGHQFFIPDGITLQFLSLSLVEVFTACDRLGQISTSQVDFTGETRDVAPKDMDVGLTGTDIDQRNRSVRIL